VRGDVEGLFSETGRWTLGPGHDRARRSDRRPHPRDTRPAGIPAHRSRRFLPRLSCVGTNARAVFWPDAGRFFTGVEVLSHRNTRPNRRRGESVEGMPASRGTSVEALGEVGAQVRGLQLERAHECHVLSKYRTFGLLWRPLSCLGMRSWCEEGERRHSPGWGARRAGICRGASWNWVHCIK
jgi:hypothetical protein